jgi:hypothetical protein
MASNRFPPVDERIATLSERIARGDFPKATQAQLRIARDVAQGYATQCGEAYIAEPDDNGEINIGAVAGGATAQVTIVRADGSTFVPDGCGPLTPESIAFTRLLGEHAEQQRRDAWAMKSSEHAAEWLRSFLSGDEK